MQSLYGPFRIINTQRYSCLTDPAGSMTPGQRLILWNCSGGEDQYWFVRTEDGPASRIINDHSSQCIGVEEVRNNGSWLVQRQCSGALDQYWDTPEPKGDRYGAFRNYQSGQYFSLGNVAGRDGVPVVQNYGCACPDQNWYFSY
ncbi:hypothetical protein GCM10022235_02540 [Kribbella ginsengisoli]|uniref:Ricin B lectin domain-containing protein n=1 Tax=Kribbella ginsengisoli TaxID=363865 RepID=A0ABP6VS77_9ACTN